MPATSPRIFIHVQHLLGTGHLRRMALLAAQLAKQGADVLLVSGGMPVTHLAIGRATLVQLPPMRARDGNFSDLVDEHDQPISARLWEAREKILLQHLIAFQPDLVLTETFPFGRRALRHELLTLLQQTKQRYPHCKIVASVRDILQPKQKPQRTQEVLQWVSQYYDAVLVHGDRTLVPLHANWPALAALTPKLHFTGYVAGDVVVERRPQPRGQEVIVSAGGGAVGLPLLQAAIAAQPLSVVADWSWRILVGDNISQADFQSLQNHATEHVIVERNRPDFRALLAQCGISVSQAGYNTVIDLLSTGAPALLVPYEAQGELEQAYRARYLSELNRASVLPEAQLSPQALAQAVDETVSTTQSFTGIQLTGVTSAADQLIAWATES